MDDVDRYLKQQYEAMTNTTPEQRAEIYGAGLTQAPPEYFERKRREFIEEMDFQRRVRERLAANRESSAR